MSEIDLDDWMWAEALRRLEHADRLQHRARVSAAAPRRQWEPPVDIFETRDAIWVAIALPGVSPDRVTGLHLRGDELIITGERPVAAPDAHAVLHRLEIPHGRFERRIPLPHPRAAISHQEFVDGCLYLTLQKH